jgi:hypothetical protein
MPEDYEKLETRFDKVEAWQEAQVAVEKEREAVESRRHVHIQLATSVISTLSMLINLYLTIYHGK